MGGDASRGRQYAESGEHRDPVDQVNVQKSNQVNFDSFRGSFLEPAPRLSRTRPPDVVVEIDWTATRGQLAGEEGFEPSIS